MGRRIGKYLLLFVVTLCLFAVLGGFSASAEEDVWEFDSSAQTLTRNGVVLQNVTRDEHGLTIGKNSGFSGKLDLGSGLVRESNGASFYISAIGTGAFENSPNLSEVWLPDNISYIGAGAFSNCTVLSYVSIPKQLTFIGDSAFRNCSALEGKWEFTDSLINLGDNAFRGCSKISEMIVPCSITYLGQGVFADCTNLVNAYITDGVPYISDEAFKGCSKLTGPLSLPNSIEYIGGSAFAECSMLSEITIPDTVGKIASGAFRECIRLTNIEIPSAALTIESYTFSGCTGLAYVTIPESVNKIGVKAFYNCNELKKVIFRGSCPSFGASDIFSPYQTNVEILYPKTKERSWKNDSSGAISSAKMVPYGWVFYLNSHNPEVVPEITNGEFTLEVAADGNNLVLLSIRSRNCPFAFTKTFIRRLQHNNQSCGRR